MEVVCLKVCLHTTTTSLVEVVVYFLGSVVEKERCIDDNHHIHNYSTLPNYESRCSWEWLQWL